MNHIGYLEIERDNLRLERDLLRASNALLLEIAKAFESYLIDDSRSERRRAVCLADTQAAIAKAESKGE